MQENWYKMQVYSNVKRKFAQSLLFLTFEQPFMYITTKENASKGYFFYLFELGPDPDPHFLVSWIRIRIQKNCWIRIRKK